MLYYSASEQITVTLTLLGGLSSSCGGIIKLCPYPFICYDWCVHPVGGLLCPSLWSCPSRGGPYTAGHLPQYKTFSAI